MRIAELKKLKAGNDDLPRRPQPFRLSLILLPPSAIFYENPFLGGRVAPETPHLPRSSSHYLYLPANMDQLCQRPFHPGWRFNRRFFFIFTGPPAGDFNGFLFFVVPAAESPQALRALGVCASAIDNPF